MSHSEVAILGGGPIGVEAALACVERGLSPKIYERDTIGENIHKWRHVRLFSPFCLNSSERGRQKLAGGGRSLPKDDSLLTGSEFLDQYLKPLASLPELADCTVERTRVLNIGREVQLKGDHIGSRKRSESRFRLLLESHGTQRIATADYVLDCTGTFGNHNWLGNGGIPCLGEDDSLQQIRYDLPDILGTDKEEFSGKRILVLGAGYSAATNVVALAELAKSDSRTQVDWVTRSFAERPLTPIENDSLNERDELTSQANQLASDPKSVVNWTPRWVVECLRLTKESNDQIEVTLSSGNDEQRKTLTVDRIIANVGFRPDRSIYEELQIHECYATQGPMKLAAALLGENSADCLAQASHGALTLQNPEPNFYILGAKSYGRSSRFLIKIGLVQIEQVVFGQGMRDRGARVYR